MNLNALKKRLFPIILAFLGILTSVTVKAMDIGVVASAVERFTLVDDNTYTWQLSTYYVSTSYYSAYGLAYSSSEIVPVSGRDVLQLTEWNLLVSGKLTGNYQRSKEVFSIGGVDYVLIASDVVPKPNGATSTVAKPVISKAPKATSKGMFDVGAALSLSVTLKSSEGVSYQWKRDGYDISGANSATYTVDPLTAADNGSYTVTVTNSGGSVISKSVDIIVFTAPVKLPINASLNGSINWTDSLEGPFNQDIDIDIAKKTFIDFFDPDTTTTYTYKRTGGATGLLKTTSVWKGSGKATETTKLTYTLSFGAYDSFAGAWPVTLSGSGKYSGKDSTGKAYKGTLNGSGSVVLVKP